MSASLVSIFLPLYLASGSGGALDTDNEDPGKPLPRRDIHLSVVEVVLYALLLPITLHIAWKHRKSDLGCWSMLALFLMTRLIADGIVIADSSDVVLNAIARSMTTSISIMCLTNTLLRMSAEAFFLITPVEKHLPGLIIITSAHLIIAAGTGLTTYGGGMLILGRSDTDTSSMAMYKVGNCMMLFVILVAFIPLIWTLWCVLRSRHHPQRRNAILLVAWAFVGMPFQVIRLVHSTAYAFVRIPSLDPYGGSFLTQLFLIFGTQLCIVLSALAGGWMSSKF